MKLLAGGEEKRKLLMEWKEGREAKEGNLTRKGQEGLEGTSVGRPRRGKGRRERKGSLMGWKEGREGQGGRLSRKKVRKGRAGHDGALAPAVAQRGSANKR